MKNPQTRKLQLFYRQKDDQKTKFIVVVVGVVDVFTDVSWSIRLQYFGYLKFDQLCTF